jgi:hypothetical protein
VRERVHGGVPTSGSSLPLAGPPRTPLQPEQPVSGENRPGRRRIPRGRVATSPTRRQGSRQDPLSIGG